MNTPKTLSMQQQLQFELDKILQNFNDRCFLYISSAVTLMLSALSIPTVAYVSYKQHNGTAILANSCMFCLEVY
jgi:hypothetical protein